MHKVILLLAVLSETLGLLGLMTSHGRVVPNLVL